MSIRVGSIITYLIIGVVLLLFFVFPRSIDFFFSNIYYVLGAFCLYASIQLYKRGGLNNTRSRPNFFAFFTSVSPQESLFSATKSLVFNSFLGFGFAIFIGATPYMFIGLPLIVHYGSVDFWGNTLLAVILFGTLVVFQIAAGYYTFIDYGNSILKYGTICAFLYACLLGGFIMLLPCSRASCAHSQADIIRDFLSNPVQSYAMLTLVGFVLAFCLMVGIVFAHIRYRSRV